MAQEAGIIGILSLAEISKDGGGTGKPLQYSCLGNPMDRRPGGLHSMGSQKVGRDLSD